MKDFIYKIYLVLIAQLFLLGNSCKAQTYDRTLISKIDGAVLEKNQFEEIDLSHIDVLSKMNFLIEIDTKIDIE